MERGAVIKGQYRLETLLGEGGFGSVWSAHQTGLERRVAIKLLKPGDEQMMRRFAVEARALGRLNHRNCVEIFASGTTEAGVPFLVMELLEGRALAELRGQRLPIPTVREIVCQMCDGLEFAHREGIIHRDLKLENVFLVDSKHLFVKVLDFGIAKMQTPDLPDITKTGEVLGTPHYMSPEQLRGATITVASDLYALGVVLYELIEGQHPFRGPDMLTIAMGHLNHPAPHITRPDCPDWLRAIVSRLLEKDPAARFPSAAALRRALEEEGEQARAPATLSSDRRLPSWAWTVPVAAVAVGVVLLLFRADESEPSPAPTVAAVQPAAAVRDVVTAELIDVGGDVGSSTDAAGEDLGDIDVPPWGSAGCTQPLAPTPGTARISFRSPTNRYPAFRHISSSYDPRSPAPVLVLLLGAFEKHVPFLRMSGFLEIAEEAGLVVLIPETLHAYYADDLIVAEVEAFIEAERDALCLDKRRTYVVGHSQGAIAAQRLSCKSWVTAAVLSSHAKDDGMPWPVCGEADPAPTLALWPMKSNWHPAEGGHRRECRPKPVYSLREMEAFQAEVHGCRGEPDRQALNEGVCMRWDCRVPYVSCWLDGGHAWPGTLGREPVDSGVQRFTQKVKFDLCDGKPANFPAARFAWEFFKLTDRRGAPNQKGSRH